MCNQDNSGNREQQPSKWILGSTISLAVIVLALFIVITISDAAATWTAEGSQWNSGPGIRGDFWGGHMAAASGFAGAILMFGALLLQNRELGLQRRDLKVQQTEFKKAREEAERQANAMEEQVAHAKRQAESERYQAMLRLLMDIGERAVDAREHGKKDPRPLLKAGFGRIVGQAHRDVAEADQAQYRMALANETLDLFLGTVVGISTEELSSAWDQALEIQMPVELADVHGGQSAADRMGEWIKSAGERIKA